jgi:hypothetical protein
MINTIITRMRRRIDIVRLDAKARQDVLYHDMDELLSLLDMLVLELDAKLAESEARSEVLETLVMDVAADLYNDVPAHEIDQRIGDVMKQLDEEEEDQ